MLFKDFKTLVEFNTQDSQSKLPTKFTDWQLLIQQSIKRLSDVIEIQELITSNVDDTEYRDIYYTEEDDDTNFFIKEPTLTEDVDSKINIQEDLVMAIVYDLSQMFTLDANLKQKFMMDREMVVSDYLWNKYKKEELEKWQN